MTSKTREKWRRRVSAWLASGLSRETYAAQHELNARTLAWWRWKLSSEGVELPTETPPFVEVTGALVEFTAEAGRDAEPLQVRMAGVVVDVPVGFDAPTLSRLLDVLECRA